MKTIYPWIGVDQSCGVSYTSNIHLRIWKMCSIFVM